MKINNQTNTPLKRKVFVAMSGGVDSSAAAALLKKRGFDVIGVFMKPWQPDLQPTTNNQRQDRSLVVGRQSLVSCFWQQDREDAMRAASVLGIPLLTWDFSRSYKKSVTDYMIREYKSGRTPNPDVMCNKEIKFGLFFDRAIKEGADYIATGHYVKLRSSDTNTRMHTNDSNLKFVNSSGIRNSCRLFIAKDKNKDQSYFLWTLNQKVLSRCLFPIGEYAKSEVRKLAKKFGLPNHDKKDSQGVCFIGPLDMKDFLVKYIKPKPGKIILSRLSLDIQGSALNNEIGTHDGVYYYTIGQRHGLNIGNGSGPYYVISKDVKKNLLYVGTEGDLDNKEAKITGIEWINPTWKLNFQVTEELSSSVEIEVKIRYRNKSEKATLFKDGTLRFKNPARAITPGQSAVFYRGQEMLGGGIIE